MEVERLSIELIHHVARENERKKEKEKERMAALDIDAIIVGVNQLESLSPCKKLTSSSDPIATCTNCHTRQQITKSKLSARLYIEDITGNSYSLRAYSDTYSQ